MSPPQGSTTSAPQTLEIRHVPGCELYPAHLREGLQSAHPHGGSAFPRFLYNETLNLERNRRQPCSTSPVKLSLPRRITTTIRSFLQRRTGVCSGSATTPTDMGTITCSRSRLRARSIHAPGSWST